ncbi:deoxynucleoside kinase [Lepeophtheirus salmonis]|uniref:deoxynucleoside kinase n=1 Tax=Lepeophtheirus salmonis TaxID=72036 RepID=UPI001AEB4BF3|nr:deoxynucleoside kinase-like [Lepeophtheirus salmonis]
MRAGLLGFLFFLSYINLPFSNGLSVIDGSPGLNISDYEGEVESEWNEKIIFPSAEEMISRNKPYIINVEGIVGTGKSTFLNYMKEYPYFDVLPEPMNKWTNLNGTDLLGLVFENPSRWSLIQESYVQLTLTEEHLRPYGIVKMMERSPHSAWTIFARQFYEAGQMTEVEFNVLGGWYNFLNEHLDLTCDLTIYLRLDPEIAYKRVTERGRTEEKNLSLDFLKRLHRLHDDWLLYRNTSMYLPTQNILVIDTSRPLEEMELLYKHLGKKIWKSIPKEMITYCDQLSTTEEL